MGERERGKTTLQDCSSLSFQINTDEIKVGLTWMRGCKMEEMTRREGDRGVDKIPVLRETYPPAT